MLRARFPNNATVEQLLGEDVGLLRSPGGSTRSINHTRERFAADGAQPCGRRGAAGGPRRSSRR
eukprot:13481547-Alexandrium_andersonii.AAC.1